jgi:hypothetical protein
MHDHVRRTVNALRRPKDAVRRRTAPAELRVVLDVVEDEARVVEVGYDFFDDSQLLR